MKSDGYALIRAQTLAWLLERHRVAGEPVDLPVEVAQDLREAVVKHLPAPTADDPLRSLGPVLSAEEQMDLLAADSTLNLPAGSGGEFWKLVVRVVHAMGINESEAILRLIGER